ncbi:MAG: DUF2510 domain-containing protein [Nitriliruptoraceae bacterium]
MTYPAAWHPDPLRRYEYRYWDGQRWTEHVANQGVAGVDPTGLEPATSPAATQAWGARTAQPQQPTQPAGTLQAWQQPEPAPQTWQQPAPATPEPAAWQQPWEAAAAPTATPEASGGPSSPTDAGTSDDLPHWQRPWTSVTTVDQASSPVVPEPVVTAEPVGAATDPEPATPGPEADEEQELAAPGPTADGEQELAAPGPAADGEQELAAPGPAADEEPEPARGADNTTAPTPTDDEHHWQQPWTAPTAAADEPAEDPAVSVAEDAGAATPADTEDGALPHWQQPWRTS